MSRPQVAAAGVDGESPVPVGGRAKVDRLGGDETERITLGPITLYERNDETGMWPVGVTDFLPPKTRSFDVILTFTRAAGSYNEGFADNLELILEDYTP